MVPSHGYSGDMGRPDNRRYISRQGHAEGPYTVDQLYEMIVSRRITCAALFWSDRKQAWKPITGLMLDIDPDQTGDFLREGVREVKILGSEGGDCIACLRLVDKIFPIDHVPELPPAACECTPWCRLVIAPVREGKAT